MTNVPYLVSFKCDEPPQQKNVLALIVFTDMTRTATKPNNPRVFEEAREAIIKLTTLSRVLTRAELETLELLFDKRAMTTIGKSLQEAEQRKYEPIATIR